MQLIINQPPFDVATTDVPSTNELAARSNNTMSPLRLSLDGRRFIVDIQGIPLDLNGALKSICDAYPDGVNDLVTNAKAQGGGSGSFPGG